MSTAGAAGAGGTTAAAEGCSPSSGVSQTAVAAKATAAAAGSSSCSITTAAAAAGGGGDEAFVRLQQQQRRRWTLGGSQSVLEEEAHIARDGQGLNGSSNSSGSGSSIADCFEYSDLYRTYSSHCQAAEAAMLVPCVSSPALHERRRLHKSAKQRVIQLMLQQQEAGIDYSSSSSVSTIKETLSTEFSPVVAAAALKAVLTYGDSGERRLPLLAVACKHNCIGETAAAPIAAYIPAEPCPKGSALLQERRRAVKVAKQQAKLAKQQALCQSMA